jgi:hypothetical protein
VAAAAVVIGGGMLGATPARAEILIGGFNLGSSSQVSWTAPGFGQAFADNFPSPNQGQEAAEVAMVAGTLTHLQVIVKPTGQDGGKFRIKIYINGAATDLTCAVTVSGMCTSDDIVVINDGDLLAVKIQNQLTDGGSPAGVLFSYSFELL